MRDRVTVTIKRDLLARLDALIDNQRIRNRSHALEVVLTRALDMSTKQAVILASGKGVKMRPFTYEIPKPLIPVGGVPLLEHGITLLRDHGIKDIIITVSHLAKKITDHFGDGSSLGVKITYMHEKKPTGTGGALQAARARLADDSFILLYGDVLLNLDLTEFLQTSQTHHNAAGTIALTSVADPSAYGAVKLRGSRVVEFSEKPPANSEVSRLVFAGCAALTPEIFKYFGRKKGTVSLEKDIFPKVIADNRLYGYPFEGQWFDVSTPETYEQVVRNWPRTQPQLSQK